jgi:predicted DNA binding CopG/RHH family protein
MKYYELDKEEKQLLKEVEAGEWKRVKNFAKLKKYYQQIARNTLNKNRNINIRITERTFFKLRTKAIEEGIPYQTLASSVLHKFVNKYETA